MYLSKEKLQHLNSIAHEGKVVVFATDADGKISYTVKQDGFEDSYLNTRADRRTGWENWQALEFPDEKDDQSVIDKETAELTYQNDPNKFILKSCYKTQKETAVAPVQVISVLGHIYVFRQSKSNTLLVDRFVLDGMTNKLNRKLEVRFKRSKQKHTPTKNMNKGSNGLVNIDSLDFRDANGNFFYEPTTELCLVNNLHKGWFSVVLVPTIENDVYRWHIFAYNSQTHKVELTTIRASEEGLFDAKDYTIFEESNDILVPRKIPAVIKRSLDIVGVTVTNGLSATKYNLQQEQQTQSGEKQLLKTATRLMLAIPTNKGTVAFSFAIASDGTLAQIDETPDSTLIRSRQREVLLPLNTLDEIKAIGDITPPPQGIITGLAQGTDAEEIEDLVKVSTNDKAAKLANGDLVKITGTSDYQGLYRTKKVDENTFEIDLTLDNGLGYWEKEDQEEGGLIFDGMITAYEKTADGKLRVTCPNHGLEDGEEVQIAGTEDYNHTYPIQKIDDSHFVIERKWATGEAVNIKLVSQKRRGVAFDGVDDYVSLPEMNHNFSQGFTVEAWVWYDGFTNWSRIIDFGEGAGIDNIVFGNVGVSNDLVLEIFLGTSLQTITASAALESNKWIHIATTVDVAGTAKLYKNGQQLKTNQTGKISLPNTLKRTKNYIGKGNWSHVGYFQGKISDLRIWKVARTDKDIKNTMYLQLTGKEVGLVGYWRLGGISEGKVIDFSVNGNDGTVYGDAYVSAATLNRKLAGGTDAVKYSNSELFAVSGRSTYTESFEFKVNSTTTVDLAYLNNADGKGNKIFNFAYWGKTSRSAEEKKSISAVQNKFENLGNGWYRASCNVTIPDGISVVRLFEIVNIQGNWASLEIRKHRVQLVSDAITEERYTDNTNLTLLASQYHTLPDILQKLVASEQKEGSLLLKKWKLERELLLLQDLTIRAKLEEEETKLKLVVEALKKTYEDTKANFVNYWCKVVVRHTSKVLSMTKPNYVPSEIFGQKEWLDKDGQRWTFENVEHDKDYYYIVEKSTAKVLTVDKGLESDGAWLSLTDKKDLDYQKWKIVRLVKGYNFIAKHSKKLLAIEFGVKVEDGRVTQSTPSDSLSQQWEIETLSNDPTNPSVDQAKKAWDDKQNTLVSIQEQLALVKSKTDEGIQKREAELAALKTQLNQTQADLVQSNAKILAMVGEQPPQVMAVVTRDKRGLETKGALLGFVQPASRLNAIETCEGNVQLSYFDIQGRMRQTNYDATGDSNNAAFEQWIPNAQRACLNFSNSNSIVKLNQPLYLPQDWSIEAWFVYPLPEAGEQITLTRGQNADCHIIVRNRKQLGIYLENDSLGQKFYDSGFNMESLPQGWHHLTAVGKGDTTLFYIDGKKVGNTKEKALTNAAEENLKKTSNDNTAKKKVEEIEKATLKVTSDIYAIANHDGNQQFGKVAEVRIWGVALSDEEIAVNSKTLLSGNEPGLLAYYPLNEATGEIVRDHSGNGHDGTVSGANWWGCTAPIGNTGNTVMKFDGVNDCISTSLTNLSGNAITIEYWFKGSSLQSAVRQQNSHNNFIVAGWNGKHIFSEDGAIEGIDVGSQATDGNWHHIAMTWQRNTTNGFVSYLDGILVQKRNSKDVAIPNMNAKVYIGSFNGSGEFTNGQIADVRIWNKARAQAEIQADMYQRLSGKEPNLVAYYPLNEIKVEDSTQKVLDLAGQNHGTVTGAITVDDNTLPIGGDALVSNEYSTVILENNCKVPLIRRFFAYPATNGATLLPDKRIEALDLKWIGNAQFAPTLLGYIEGPPPVPSENLTLSDDYNGATSVELTMSEDVEFSWNRSQDSGLGASIDTFLGTGGTMSMGIGTEIETSTKVGFQGNFDFSYQFQNESNITSRSSLSMTDKLELRGTPEETAKFPHLGKRFIPKNIGYALVVSAIADVFVTRLARSGKMVGYQVQPVDGIAPDINTITFLMNSAYTMNGSLDGLTGSSATTDRFFKHVPEMRSQYGSLYPASYYRLLEAYALKQQIEAEDKRRESYFSNFDVRLVDETSLNRNIDSGDAPTTIGVQREEDKPSTQITNEEKQKEQYQKAEQFQSNSEAASAKTSDASKAKQAEIQSQIRNQEKRVQATDSFAGWQKRMESLQVRSGKRNIVNTYVWDADGGLRTEAQSFANTVEHTIGGSFSMNAGLGVGSEFSVGGVDVELTAQATVNLTQTMSKTEARSKGFELNVDLSGLEYKGITDYNDNPILPGEKVDRYRFMSFYLEGSTNNFQDFFSYVVDPEWLRSNDEEARALRQAQAGKPNKAWRVLHRVTYVERPALMGFGRDVRKLKASAATSENQQLLDKIATLEEKNQKLEEKLDTILNWVESQKQSTV